MSLLAFVNCWLLLAVLFVSMLTLVADRMQAISRHTHTGSLCQVGADVSNQWNKPEVALSCV